MQLNCKVRFNDQWEQRIPATLIAVLPADPALGGGHRQSVYIAGEKNLIDARSGDAVVILKEFDKGKLLQLPMRLVSDVEPREYA